MLRKLHEIRRFDRILDAGAEGRYRAILTEHLPGATWLGTEAWTPVLDGLRLRRRNGRLDCADIRIAAAALLAGLDLVLFEDVFEHLERDDALALAGAWLEHSALVLVSLSARLPVGAELPGLRTTFRHADTAVRFLSSDVERSRQVTLLHSGITAVVIRRLGEPGAMT